AANDLNQFIRSKEKLGFKTKLVLLSETGSNTTSIKNYIQNAYDNWENPPEFVLLIGDVNGALTMPAFYVDGYYTTWDVTDHSYTLLDGDDYFPDVLIGRISVQSLYELDTVVAKLMNYEFNPYTATNWMKKAIVLSYVTTNYWQFFSPRETVMEVREKLLDFEYAQVDTFIEPYSSGGSAAVRSMINGGYSFVNYRGCGAPGYWNGYYADIFSISDIQQLNNGDMLPFITSMTCGGGDFASTSYSSVFGETWLNVGTPSTRKGAIGFIGPSEHDTKTWFNNANCMGIYQGITQEGIFRGGEMLLRGKMELYNNFPYSHAWGNSLNSDQFYFYVYNLLGDPSLRVWTDVPNTITFEAPEEIDVRDNAISVTMNGFLAEDFLIALTCDDSLVCTGITGMNGNVILPVQLAEGTYYLTASKYGYIPVTDTLIVTDQNIVAATGIMCNPPVAGTSVDFVFTVINPTVNNEDISVELTTDDDFIEITTPITNSSITVGNSESFVGQFNLAPEWLDGQTFRIFINVTSSAGTHSFLLSDEVQSPSLCLSQFTVLNANNCLLQGVVNEVNIELLNCGILDAQSFDVQLFTQNENASVIGGTSSYEPIAANSTGTNSSTFQIGCESVMTGEIAEFLMKVYLSDEVVQELIISMPIGVVTQESPTFCDY
ncbi:MAG TPA: C25 family cysteine peptidase, partial [Candidatus Cloacimonadota bacterium]|nr:C25 family cysteine peptidase [Candidatus Cloacimonadota bacterium]